MNKLMIGERIAALRKQLDLTQESLASKLGCSAVTIGYWENGRHTPSGSRLITLAKALSTTPDYLISGSDSPKLGPEMDSARKNDEFLISPTGIGKGLRRWEASQNIPEFKHKREDLVPLISWVQAGSWCESPDNYAAGDAEDWMYCPSAHSSGTFALRVVGDSMISPSPHERSYPPGIIIFVDPERVPLAGSRVIARAPNSSEVTFKVFASDGGVSYLRPLNPQYPTIPMPEGTVICGVVIGSYWPE